MSRPPEAPFTGEEMAPRLRDSHLMKDVRRVVARVSAVAADARVTQRIGSIRAEIVATAAGIVIGVTAIAVIIGMALHVVLVLVAQPYAYPSRVALVIPGVLVIAGVIAFMLRELKTR